MAVFFCLSLGCFSGKPEQPNERDEAQPLMPAPKTVRIPSLFAEDRSSIQCDVPVSNPTERAVRFTDIRQSCSCMGSIKLAATQLAPGEKTTLHFDLNLQQRTGPQRFTCQLVEAGGPTWTYHVETTIYRRAAFAEVGSLHFGMLGPRCAATRTTGFIVSAESLDALPQAVSFRTDSESLTIKPRPAVLKRESDGVVVQTIPLNLGLKSGDKPGLQYAPVYADVLRRDGQKLQLKATATWHVRPPISASPAQAYFGAVDHSSSTVLLKKILISCNDGRPLVLKSFKSPCSALQCALDKKIDNSTACLLLTIDPRAVPTPFWCDLLVETDHPQQPQVSIPVAALARTGR
jgi:hypothetical protein